MQKLSYMKFVYPSNPNPSNQPVKKIYFYFFYFIFFFFFTTGVGGIAGGEKFIYQNILFKFAADAPVAETPKRIWMYGGAAGPNDNFGKKIFFFSIYYFFNFLFFILYFFQFYFFLIKNSPFFNFIF